MQKHMNVILYIWTIYVYSKDLTKKNDTNLFYISKINYEIYTSYLRVMSEWYTSMNQAPWTPPGLFFGFAWTTIMICFSIYMSYAWGKIKNHKKLLTLFGIQFVLNIIWNPIFFSWHYV